ncbi:uncharacterized protein [Panulirus ornatus]|uniref:uncharacterized protein n=1 Tax=Panulirus ornatus TaxID=150431 RepID=UPI003A89D5DF
MKCGSEWAGVKVDCESIRGEEEVMHTTLDQLLQQYYQPNRSARDGYGGGGCGGFEVFAFLAFLLALLDLLLDLNDMDDGAARRMRRHDRSAHHGSHNCSAELEVQKAVWAASQVTEGVLMALNSPPACGHAYLCHAAAAAASRGPLAAMFTRLAGEWLDRWPGLRGSELGQVTLTAAATLTCPDYHHPTHSC